MQRQSTARNQVVDAPLLGSSAHGGSVILPSGSAQTHLTRTMTPRSPGDNVTTRHCNTFSRVRAYIASPMAFRKRPPRDWGPGPLRTRRVPNHLPVRAPVVAHNLNVAVVRSMRNKAQHTALVPHELLRQSHFRLPALMLHAAYSSRLGQSISEAIGPPVKSSNASSVLAPCPSDGRDCAVSWHPPEAMLANEHGHGVVQSRRDLRPNLRVWLRRIRDLASACLSCRENRHAIRHH